MNDRDPLIQAAFAQTSSSIDDEGFLQDVCEQLDKSHRNLVLRRIALALLVGLVAMPLQDIGLVIARLLMVAVVDIEAGLAAILLAPINTVGGVLSLFLFVMRLLQRRIFRRA